MTTKTELSVVSPDTVEDWVIKSALYLEITDGEDHLYWCGFNDAVRAVLGQAPGLE